MHSYEDRIRAVELYYRYGKKASVVVMELGYPSTKQLGVGFGFMKRRAIYPELKPRERYSRTQKIAAVEHYLTHGGCLSYTRRAIGYPSNEIQSAGLKSFTQMRVPGHSLRHKQMLQPGREVSGRPGAL
ncbi:Putative transposase (identified by ISEscan HMM) [Klebsiella pneumoniae]|nr:Putative transposase (identified by ISEscan HMM) [Klebsiella pneumoniae]